MKRLYKKISLSCLFLATSYTSLATKSNYSNKPRKFGFDYFRKIDKRCLKNNRELCKYKEISIKEDTQSQVTSEPKKKWFLKIKKIETFYSRVKLRAYKKYLKTQKSKEQRYDRSKIFEKNWGKKRRRMWKKIANNY